MGEGRIVNPIIPDELVSRNPVELVQSVILTLINVFYVVGVVTFFFMLVIGGIQWLSSGGDKGALANAQARIQHAIIGLVVLMAAYAIVTLVEAVFGINILLIDIGTLTLSGEGGGQLSLVPDSGVGGGAAEFNITSWIPTVINLLFVIAVVVFFFMLVTGGIRWIGSGGDKGLTQAARGQITSAVVGLLITLSAYAIVNLLEMVFGITILEGLDLTGEPVPTRGPMPTPICRVGGYSPCFSSSECCSGYCDDTFTCSPSYMAPPTSTPTPPTATATPTPVGPTGIAP